MINDADRSLLAECDEYPTEDVLERIKNWEHSRIADVFDFIEAAWSSFGSVRRSLSEEERAVVLAGDDDVFFRLATGGWSGNEDIVAAMEESQWIRFYWRLSSRGGLHIYELPKG